MVKLWLEHWRIGSWGCDEAMVVRAWIIVDWRDGVISGDIDRMWN